VANGVRKGIDTEEERDEHGRLGVLTGADLNAVGTARSRPDVPVPHSDGSPMKMQVAAISHRHRQGCASAATRASSWPRPCLRAKVRREAVMLDIDALPAVTTRAKRQPGAPIVFDERTRQ